MYNAGAMFPVSFQEKLVLHVSLLIVRINLTFLLAASMFSCLHCSHAISMVRD